LALDTNTLLLSNRFEQIELNIINLAWDIFSVNTLFDDVYIDNFEDTTGINPSSVYLYDDINNYIKRTSSATNITLITNLWNSTFTNPSSSYCFIKIVVPVTTHDVSASISVDNGTTYYLYSDLYEFLRITSVTPNIVYLRGDVHGIPHTDDNRIVFKVNTNNNSNIYISNIAFGLSY
jgi:hypothetical protein